MRNKPLWISKGFSGVTIGGSGGGQPLPLVILTVVVLAMALVTVYDAAFSSANGINVDKEIPFKCTNAKCGNIAKYTIRELQAKMDKGEMDRPGPMQLMKLTCPKCGKKTLTQSVECPKCGAIFILDINPTNDKCPKCGESFGKAWQEKYKESGEE